MSKTKRIEFEDTGDYWTIYTYLTVAAEREWIKHAIDSQATYADPSDELINSLARRMDELVVGQTVEWSYGEVSVDVLRNEIPAHHYHEVMEVMDSIYSPLVIKSIERGLRNYSLVSNREQSP